VPDHSTFSKNRHGRFRDSDVLRRLFETVLQRCIGAGLVGGEGFAVDASLIQADASDRNRVDGAAGLPPTAAGRAIEEYLATLDDAAFGAASQVTPKFDTYGGDRRPGDDRNGRRGRNGDNDRNGRVTTPRNGRGNRAAARNNGRPLNPPIVTATARGAPAAPGQNLARVLAAPAPPGGAPAHAGAEIGRARGAALRQQGRQTAERARLAGDQQAQQAEMSGRQADQRAARQRTSQAQLLRQLSNRIDTRTARVRGGFSPRR